MFDLKRLSKIEWHYIHQRTRTPLYSYLLWEGLTQHYNRKVLFPYHAYGIIYLDGQIAATDAEWERMRATLLRHLKKDPLWLKRMLHDSYVLNGRMEAWCKKMERADLGKKSAAELEKLWGEYITPLYEFGAYIILPLLIEQDMEKELKKAIMRIYGSAEADTVFQTLTTPLKVGATQQEQESLYRLALKEKQGKLTNSLVLRHLRMHSWIKNNGFDGSFYSEAELRRRITVLARKQPQEVLARFAHEHRVLKAHYKKFISLVGKDKKIKALVETLQESIFHRSWRTERFYRNAYFLQNFFRITARRTGLKTVKDLFYFTPVEIQHALRTSTALQPKIALQRKKEYGCYGDSDGTIILQGALLQRAKRAINVLGVVVTKEINGATAYPGKVSGPVVVIRSKHELGKIKHGCILVTPSTTVDYVPHLKKVKAIIANEGGVLSHASVIARELRIPCIIGTKVGTSVLFDGQQVTVDATRGTVLVKK